MYSIPLYSSQQPCEVGWVSYNFLRIKAAEAQRWLMIYVEVVDISYGRDKVTNFNNFKGYETHIFLYHIQRFLTSNFYKLLQNLSYYISYSID